MIYLWQNELVSSARSKHYTKYNYCSQKWSESNWTIPTHSIIPQLTAHYQFVQVALKAHSYAKSLFRSETANIHIRQQCPVQNPERIIFFIFIITLHPKLAGGMVRPCPQWYRTCIVGTLKHLSRDSLVKTMTEALSISVLELWNKWLKSGWWRVSRVFLTLKYLFIF